MYLNYVPIVFAADNDYAIPFAIAVCSLLDNALADTFYEIYLLQDTSFCQLGIDTMEIITKLYSNFVFKQINVDTKSLKGAKSFLPYISNTTFYRLLISELLPQYDRVIYLDSDIVVRNDLNLLYHMDLQDNYIAASPDWDMQLVNEKNISHMQEMGFNTLNGYINAGVLLMNLKKIREDKKVIEFTDKIDKQYSYGDQDILNVCCRGNILFLSTIYNLKARYYKSPKTVTHYINKEHNAISSCMNPYIVHFVGDKVKPWENRKCKGSEIWWEYALKCLSLDTYKKIIEDAIIWYDNISWKKIVSWSKAQSNLIIFGDSVIGRSVVTALRKTGFNNIKCICDNDVSKQGFEFEGINVVSIEDAYALYPNAGVIVTSQLYYKEIFEQLSQYKVPEQSRIRYYHKGKIYFISLSKEFFDEEIFEIYYKEYGIETRDTLLVKQTLRNDIPAQQKYYLNEWFLAEE